jgi:hypothetical protein
MVVVLYHATYEGVLMALTLRFHDEGEERDLKTVASVDGQSITAVVHTAINAHIAARRADPEFQARLQRRHDEEEGLYRRLAT